MPVFCDPHTISDNCVIRGHVLHSSLLCIRLKKQTHTLTDIYEAIVNHVQVIIKNSSVRGGGWINISSNTIKQLPL